MDKYINIYVYEFCVESVSKSNTKYVAYFRNVNFRNHLTLIGFFCIFSAFFFGLIEWILELIHTFGYCSILGALMAVLTSLINRNGHVLCTRNFSLCLVDWIYTLHRIELSSIFIYTRMSFNKCCGWVIVFITDFNVYVYFFNTGYNR